MNAKQHIQQSATWVDGETLRDSLNAAKAQFRHNYSAMFLATITTISCTLQRAGFGILMQLVAEGWRHGRETPAMMDIQWEAEWNRSIEEIRRAHGIPVYQSVLPANLFESAAV